MALLLVAGSIGLAACAGNPNTGSIQSTVPTPTETQEEPVKAELTWQAAKAQTQAMELEIAGLIPKDKVASVFQKETGVLLSCNKTDHNWNGWIDIALTADANVVEVIKSLELHYSGGSFEVTTRKGIDGDYQVHLLGTAPGEGYLIGRGLTPNVIRIDSGSPCFTLPEGIYPGGDF
ncbi:hypothetical protein [Arthrobacter sp. LFS091]|uniref:hypothetical protein n=1 Tax=Arthrobacter sp. LFS091 TaxID=3229892 RepID=UPI003A803D26